MNKNPYRILSSKTVYKNHWIDVREDHVVSPNGTKKVFGTVDNGEGVNIIAVNKNKEIYLIKEYYYVLKEYGVQTPAGGIEKGETPLSAAKKELFEEAGLNAEAWIPLGKVNSLTMIIKSPVHIFLALYIKEKVNTEKDIEVIKLPFGKAVDMVMNGEITLASSCLGILKAKAYLEENKI